MVLNANASVPRRVRERDLEGHFTQQEADPTEMGEAAAEGKDATSEPYDQQLERGLEVLKSWRYFERLRTPREPVSEPTVKAAVEGL